MKTILLLFIAYLLGSIPSGVWIGQLFFKRHSPIWQREYRNYEYLSCSWQISWRHCFIDGYSERYLGYLFAGDLFSHNNQSSLVWCLCYSRSHVSNFCQVQRRESGGDQRRHAFRLQSNFLHLFSAYFCDLFVHNQHGQPDKYDCSLLDHFVDNPIALCRTNDFTKTKLVIDVYRNWCHLFYFYPSS